MINKLFIRSYFFQERLSAIKKEISQGVLIKRSFCDFYYFRKYDIYRAFTSAQLSKLPKISIPPPYSRASTLNSNKIKIEPESLNRIAKLLNCSPDKILSSAQRYPKLFLKFDLENTSGKMTLLLEKFSSEDILKNLWMLECSIGDLKSRLTEMDKWKLGDNVGKLLPLMKLSSLDFHRLSAKFVVEMSLYNVNRIFFIASEMQCPIEVVVEKFMCFQSLFFRNFRQIRGNINLLKEYEITGNELLQEFAVLNTTPEKLKMRLVALAECGMVKNLWLLSAAENKFRSKVEEECEKVRILSEGKSTEDYIYEKLDLSPEEMIHLKISNPQIFKKSPTKLRDLLEFLLSSGYTTEQISANCHIFRHDLKKVKARHTELLNYGIELPKIRLLYLAQSNYDDIIERLIKNIELNSTDEEKEKNTSQKRKSEKKEVAKTRK